MRRRASDVLKCPCPWCGSSTSSVYRSLENYRRENVYRRRRECADCGRTWPTIEMVDLDLFARELAERGLTLRDLNLEPRLSADGSVEKAP